MWTLDGQGASPGDISSNELVSFDFDLVTIHISLLKTLSECAHKPNFCKGGLMFDGGEMRVEKLRVVA